MNRLRNAVDGCRVRTREARLPDRASEPARGRGGQPWSKSSAPVLAVVLASTILAACGGPVAAPDREIIHATENEISIGTWEWSRPDSIAVDHCRRFGKEAVFLSSVRAQEYSDMRIVYYSCVWPNYGG